MASSETWVIPLSETPQVDEGLIGSKASKLGQLAALGYKVPAGFCITINAYERFVERARLTDVIRMELGRKSLKDMRWEEIWDAALRIRSAFSSAPLPEEVADSIRTALEPLGAHPLVVRSSAPGEDSAERSFAGLHESFLNITDTESALEAVRLVWSSLWSDAAILYRKELGLDPARSRMAVVVQQMIIEDRSGVAFGRDPRDLSLNREIIESVPGPCSGLVDGVVDPDRWILSRTSGEVIEYRPGSRGASEGELPLLGDQDLKGLHTVLGRIEGCFGWYPDVEWTGKASRLTILQARPITTGQIQKDDKREWYLTLRPTSPKLNELRERVVGELIPRLEREGERLAAEDLESLDDLKLADAVVQRRDLLEHWREIYWDDFIPFAHGVRQIAVYYNDAVHPKDPYEFVGLLQGEEMLATRRNRVLGELAKELAGSPSVRQDLENTISKDAPLDFATLKEHLVTVGAESFAEKLEAFETEFMDLAFQGERLIERPDLIVSLILEMSKNPAPEGGHQQRTPQSNTKAELERRLLEAVGESRHQEALGFLEVGRLSWRLRDDDNLLLGRVESQLLRAIRTAAERLRRAGRLDHNQPGEKHALVLASALRDASGGVLALEVPGPKQVEAKAESTETPRQLIGQPAAAGAATGLVRRVRGPDDIARFHAGEILVCDAIQPSMTHLVPLASAIVERRGGMLIHGAIIARELGIPCVNGVSRATEILHDGDLVTVDGHFGIVTVGAAEFELEQALNASTKEREN
jgi:pyruvate,water dikinase